MKQTVLFPVKCDPVHIGHVMQIKELLLNDYDVTIDILDSADRVQNTLKVCEIIRILFDGKVNFRFHTVSYAITLPIYVTNYDYIATGNRDIISNINLSEKNIKVIPLNRFKGYRATRMRDVLRDIYDEEQ